LGTCATHSRRRWHADSAAARRAAARTGIRSRPDFYAKQLSAAEAADNCTPREEETPRRSGRAVAGRSCPWPGNPISKLPEKSLLPDPIPSGWHPPGNPMSPSPATSLSLDRAAGDPVSHGRGRPEIRSTSWRRLTTEDPTPQTGRSSWSWFTCGLEIRRRSDQRASKHRTETFCLAESWRLGPCRKRACGLVTMIEKQSECPCVSNRSLGASVSSW
jgi:hypothetical protein